jgi:hypothetical protein
MLIHRGYRGGQWRAWLSSSSMNAIDRLADVGPWYRPDQQTTLFENHRAGSRPDWTAPRHLDLPPADHGNVEACGRTPLSYWRLPPPLPGRGVNPMAMPAREWADAPRAVGPALKQVRVAFRTAVGPALKQVRVAFRAAVRRALRRVPAVEAATMRVALRPAVEERAVAGLAAARPQEAQAVPPRRLSGRALA